jgi:murein L,D-transpeptidase YcbB/YkuD
MSLTRYFSAFTALALAAACGDDKTIYTSGGGVFRSWNPAGVSDIRDIPIAEFKSEMAKLVATRPKVTTDDQWGHAKKLYAGYGNAPLWMDEDGLLEPRADALIDAMVQATADGIDIDQYPLTELIAVLDTIERSKGMKADAPKPPAATWAHADMLLTTAYVSLAEDLMAGQVDPKSVNQSWHIDPQEEKIDSMLTLSLRGKSMVEEFAKMRPSAEDYLELRTQLAVYRKMASNGGWPAVTREAGKGDSAAHAGLRARLQAEGIDASDLKVALATFQERHTIVVDSALGSETLDALNVPVNTRLTQIAANLERMRWLPRAMGEKYIYVNVPAFKLEGYEGGKKTIEMKVIVGQEYEGRVTPVFSDKMEYVVFRPYWNVTPTIAEKELFPQFAATGMPADYETYTENGQLRIRQIPGEKNALGLVKFLFPNDFNIYLHDTPNDKLFEKDVRAFSHGCIRLEKPAELAQWVLGWDRARVDKMMHGSNNQSITLKNKLPVYITYMTTYVRDGVLWYGNDLYSRDAELAQAVANGAIPSADAVRNVAALRKLTD